MDIFDGKYDDHLACSLCCAYRNGVKDKTGILDEFLRQIGPLIGIVCRFELGEESVRSRRLDRRSGVLYEEAVQVREESVIAKTDALESVYFVVTECVHDLPTNPRTFTAFMWTVIKRAMMDSLNKNSSQVFDYWQVCSEPESGTLGTYEAVESRIHLEQFDALVFDTAINDIRFSGNEREACIYIAKSLTGRIELTPNSAQFRYKLSKQRTRFLVSYMEHLISRTASDLRQVLADET